MVCHINCTRDDGFAVATVDVAKRNMSCQNSGRSSILG